MDEDGGEENLMDSRVFGWRVFLLGWAWGEMA